VSPHVRPLGDAALLVTMGADLSDETNARVLALAAGLRARPLRVRVRDIVPAIASLAVHLDPDDPGGIESAAEELTARLREALPLSQAAAGAVHEIRVRYGGGDGPDLADVAAFAGCTPREVIARHAARLYRVYMLGFLPGFAYLGDVDASIAAPRRSAPRARVPQGSVGIAGRQTGVYPRESPGGWQIIGRTAQEMFGLASGSLLQPGDRVRFVPEDTP